MYAVPTAARSEMGNTTISPDLDQQQHAGFLLLAVASAGDEPAGSGVEDRYRLELVDKRKRAVLKGPSGCAISMHSVAAVALSTECSDAER